MDAVGVPCDRTSNVWMLKETPGLERNEWIQVSNETGQGKTNAEGSTWFERKAWMP